MEKGQRDLDKEAMRYLAKYEEFVHRAPKYKVAPISAEDLMYEWRECSKSAPGPDGFEPAEMALLPKEAYQHMADLLNLIEGGAQWPRGIQEARAAFMEKAEGNVDQALKFRVLRILPALYRRWGGTRMRMLAGWVAEWSTRDIYAGWGPK